MPPPVSLYEHANYAPSSPAHKSSQDHPVILPQHRFSLPLHTTISPVKPDFLPSYKRLISTSLPIKYPERFYTLSTSDPSESGTIALCAVYDPPLQGDNLKKRRLPDLDLSQTPQVVAGIQARLEPVHPPPLGFVPQSTSKSCLTIGSQTRSPQSPQSPSKLPQEPDHEDCALYIQTLTTAPSHRTLSLATTLLARLITTALRTWSSDRKIVLAYAHVWESNTDALEWYRNRGFEMLPGKVEGYYRKLRPSGAMVVRRKICVGDYLVADGQEQDADANERKDTREAKNEM